MAIGKRYYSHPQSPGRVTSNGLQCFLGDMQRYLGSSSPEMPAQGGRCAQQQPEHVEQDPHYPK